MLSESSQSELEMFPVTVFSAFSFLQGNFGHSFEALLLINSRIQISVLVYECVREFTVCHDSGTAIFTFFWCRLSNNAR